MTAPSATELPTAQPNVPANSRHPGPRAVPSVSSVLILPPGPIVDRHRRPQERLQAARRPPAYPNQARIIAPVTPSHPSAVLTPSTCMNRWIRAKGGMAQSRMARLAASAGDVRTGASCPRSLAGKPLVGFRATTGIRIAILYGMVMYIIRVNNPLLHRLSTSRKRRLGENRGSRPDF